MGVDDPFEKDIAVGDVDKNGDPDVIVVRKARFSTPGGQPNVLFLNEGGTMVDRTADFIPQFNDATDDRDVVLIDVNDDRWLDRGRDPAMEEALLMEMIERAGVTPTGSSAPPRAQETGGEPTANG